jgi:hypothetical protein
MAVHRLKSEAPAAISPERAELAARIEAAQSANASRAAVAAAHQTAELGVFAARRKVEAAEAAVEQAKSDAATFLTAVALGTAGERPATIKQARGVLQDAEDELESAIVARTALNAQMAQGDAAPGFALMQLKDAAAAVVRSEAPAAAANLVNEVAELQAKLAEKGSALEWLSLAGVFPRGTFGGILDPVAASVWNRMMSPPNTWAGLSAEQHAGRARWQDALAALMTDATAPLPRIGGFHGRI